MSDVIRLLPDSVANQIAAGEVIQRPASVIKELVENAVDAQAHNIQIVLKEAGRNLIQVIDDGVGMSDTDARLAFERHSTSKIQHAEDLFNLRTMGFRGEALASIAAISQVELRTRKKGEQLGTKVEIEASTCVNQEPCTCAEGSNFMIKNLFFNVPARRKFLKSNQVELSNIVKEFEKVALVNPQVAMTLVHNDVFLYQLPASGFQQRIANVFKHGIETQLLPLNIETSLVRIDGFVCRPENAKKRNAQQFLFVNGRFMKHPYFHKAIAHSYDQLIPADAQPSYFLQFTVDPTTIDVNIHPTKAEIKFENEVPIWQILSAAVKESLGKFCAVPTIDFDTENAPEIPLLSKSSTITQPNISVNTNYNPFNDERTDTDEIISGGYGGRSSYGSTSRTNSSVINNWEALYANFEKKAQELKHDEETIFEVPQEEPVAAGLQLKGRYVITPVKSGLMVIDQHRAHVKILFERYMSNIKSHSISSQQILFPTVLQLTTAQSLLLEEQESSLNMLGFSLSNLGGNSWSVIGVPSIIESSSANDLILAILDKQETGGFSAEKDMLEYLALKISQKAAINYGQTLNGKEIEQLISDLLQLSDPNYTPDGKIIISIIKTEDIIKLF